MAADSNMQQTYWTLDMAGPAPTATPTYPQAPTITPSVSPTLSVTPTRTPTPTRIVTPTIRPTSTPRLTITPTMLLTLTPTINLTPSSTPLPTKPFSPTHTPTPTVSPTPTTDPSFRQNSFDTQVFVSAKVDGIGKGGNPNPRNLARKVAVNVYSMENEVVLTGFGFLKYDKNNLFRGVIHLGKIDNGIYYIKVTSEHMLQTLILPKFQELRNDRLNILPEVFLTQGDLDDSNAVDLDDFNMALTCFQDRTCGVRPVIDPNAPADANPETFSIIDFNDDGAINVTDYNILLQVYRKYIGD
jgi:hypothetical protein